MNTIALQNKNPVQTGLFHIASNTFVLQNCMKDMARRKTRQILQYFFRSATLFVSDFQQEKFTFRKMKAVFIVTQVG